MINTINKLRVIAEAKFADKSKLGSWYTDRIELCETCPLNSKNKDNLNVVETAAVAANLGQPTCLACKCEIAAKAYVREEQCGLVKLGETPIWEALPAIQETTIRGLKIESLSSDKVKMIPGKITVLDYGKIPYNFDTNIAITIEGATFKLKEVNLQRSCQCTSIQTEEKDGKYTFRLSYNSKNYGVFDKPVYVNYKRAGSNYQFKIILRGEVVTP